MRSDYICETFFDLKERIKENAENVEIDCENLKSFLPIIPTRFQKPAGFGSNLQV